MPHTNRAELNRLFANFCRFWTKGLHATVQMKTTGSGGVMAQFEFELEKPNEIFPTGPAGFRQGQPQGEPRRHPRHQPGSSHAPGHPGATGGRRSRPRRRGPKAIERSRMRAAAHQASLAAARCAVGTRACSGTVIAHSEKQIESWRQPCSETRYEKINRASQVTEDWDGRSTKNVTV